MGDPTRPTRPLGPQQPPPQRVAAREREAAYARPDDLLLEEVRRIRFWSFFGAAVATVASVLAVIALIVALGNDNSSSNGSGSSRAAVDGLRSDVSSLRS